MFKDELISLIGEFKEKNNLVLNKLEIKNFIAYQIEIKNIEEIILFLKTSPVMRFTILTDLFAADFPERNNRFEVNYNLLSLKLNLRILLKVHLGENISVPTVSKIFSSAGWYEREIFDMFGVNFTGNEDLRRILTDYGFVGHPLKKDFPLTGYVEVKYDETLKQVVNQPVKLDQDYRKFDFTSPWEGPNYILPGDEKAK